MFKPFSVFKNKTNSLFARLILGFLCIIVLLTSINTYSLSLSRSDVRDEIVKYNTQNLLNTMDNFEKHFTLVKKIMLSFLISPKIQGFRKSPEYATFPEIQKEIQNVISNNLLFIENIFLYSMKNDHQIVEVTTSTKASTMFEVFYSSKPYDYSFWLQQASQPYTVKIHPAAAFVDRTYADSPRSKGVLFPYIFKNVPDDDFFVAALLDYSQMLKSYHSSIHSLLILNGDGANMLSGEKKESFKKLIGLKEAAPNYIVEDDRYLFYAKGNETGLTYAIEVPVENISTQVKLNATTIVLLLVSIFLSLAAAILFVMRINNPLRKVLESIQGMSTGNPVRGRIREFDMISESFGKLVKDQREIHMELNHKKNQLKSFTYMNRLKKIRSSFPESEDWSFTDKPFVFVVFELLYRDGKGAAEPSEKPWSYYVKEYVEVTISLSYRESLTFQMENKQISSFIFLEEGIVLQDVLDKLKQVFDLDKEYGLITIAVSKSYKHSAELTLAYEEALELLQDRRLSGETQMIWEPADRRVAIDFSPDREQELDTHLREGNGVPVIQLIQRVLSRVDTEKIPATRIRRFAQTITDKSLRILQSWMIGEDQLSSLRLHIELLETCYTLMDYKRFLEVLVHETCLLIKEKKKQKDDASAFLIEYVEKHYEQEIYLDMLADKLGMSRGYLSTYFKEKVGMNFIDYVNKTRIDKARDLLKNPDYKIHEVAKDVGYQNINSFNRMFKKYSGVTPGEYRKKEWAGLSE